MPQVKQNTRPPKPKVIWRELLIESWGRRMRSLAPSRGIRRSRLLVSINPLLLRRGWVECGTEMMAGADNFRCGVGNLQNDKGQAKQEVNKNV